MAFLPEDILLQIFEKSAACLLMKADAPDFTIVTASDAYCRLTGLTREQLKGKGAFTLFPDQDDDPSGASITRQAILDAIASKKQTQIPEYAYHIADPETKAITEFWWSSTFDPITGPDGEVAYVLGTAIDLTDKVKNRQLLQYSEDRLNRFFMQAPAGICILSGPELTFELINPLYQQLFPGRDILGKPMLEAIPEVKGAPIWNVLQNVYTTGETFEGKELLIPLARTTDGPVEDRYFNFIYQARRNAKEEIDGILVFVIEVTTAVQTQQQLQLLINMLPASVVVIRGPQLVVEMINQANLDYWNKTTEEVIGKPLLEILPELVDQPFPGQLRQVMFTGQIIDVEESPVLFEQRDGSIRETFVDYTYQPLTDNNGQYTGVLVMSSEITGRVLAKRQVEQSEKNLKNMIAQAPVAMCILSGPDHVITVANKLIVELWGKPATDVMNKPVFEALPDARGQGLEAVMKKVYETGETFYASEMPVSLIRHGKPDIVYQNFVYQAYRDATGQIAGVFAITIDVTEQVLARKTIEQSEAELRRTKKQLEAELETSKQVQRQKDDFIGMASHELKTPLTSLNALLQVASLKLKNSEDPFLAGAMEKSNIQVKRMTAMINGFLNISRLESGKIYIEKQNFDMEALIKDMISEASLTASTHLMHFVQCPPICVNADRDKIGSVISNLINNAVKYSPKGKHIEIACITKDSHVVFSIKDEGMGIKPDDLTKIFDRYYRVQTNHTQHIAGFGIGLYLSAEIIRLHGGEIWAESESGVGSTFYFSLPL